MTCGEWKLFFPIAPTYVNNSNSNYVDINWAVPNKKLNTKELKKDYLSMDV